MKTLKRIDPMSAAKVAAAVAAIMGLINGILVSLFPNLTTGGMYEMMSAQFAAGARIIAMIAFPISYAIFGFVSGLVWSVIYNFVAEKIGGVKVDLK